MAGQRRVLGILKSSQLSGTFNRQMKDLENWVMEIHEGMYPYLVRNPPRFPALLFRLGLFDRGYAQQSNGLFVNYADGLGNNNFDEAVSSALLAATVYRLALLTWKTNFVPQAELMRAALFTTNGRAAATFSSSSSSSIEIPTSATQSPSSSTHSNPFTDMSYFTSDGWLQPVVDRLNVGVQGSHRDSPEGQEFVPMLQAAWRDWTASGSPGASNSALSSLGGGQGLRDRLPVLALLGLVVGSWLVHLEIIFSHDIL